MWANNVYKKEVIKYGGVINEKLFILLNMATSKRCLWEALNGRSEGSGAETLVLAHGYGMEQSMWDKVVPLLAESYRVVTFDWVCAGSVKNEKLYDPVKYSSYEAFADDLITLVQEMNLKDVTYVGSSMSGIIGCIASVKTPQLFKTLILVGSSPRYLLSSLISSTHAAFVLLHLCFSHFTSF